MGAAAGGSAPTLNQQGQQQAKPGGDAPQFSPEQMAFIHRQMQGVQNHPAFGEVMASKGGAKAPAIPLANAPTQEASDMRNRGLVPVTPGMSDNTGVKTTPNLDGGSGALSPKYGTLPPQGPVQVGGGMMGGAVTPNTKFTPGASAPKGGGNAPIATSPRPAVMPQKPKGGGSAPGMVVKAGRQSFGKAGPAGGLTKGPMRMGGGMF